MRAILPSSIPMLRPSLSGDGARLRRGLSERHVHPPREQHRVPGGSPFVLELVRRHGQEQGATADPADPAEREGVYAGTVDHHLVEHLATLGNPQRPAVGGVGDPDRPLLVALGQTVRPSATTVAVPSESIGVPTGGVAATNIRIALSSKAFWSPGRLFSFTGIRHWNLKSPEGRARSRSLSPIGHQPKSAAGRGRTALTVAPETQRRWARRRRARARPPRPQSVRFRSAGR